MSALKLCYFDASTPKYLVRKHIETLMDEIAYLSHNYEIEDIPDDIDEYDE
jgi:hypothetical protein